MKRIKSSVTYTVPHWAFCNNDILSCNTDIPTALCQFCIKTPTGYRCALYDRSLSSMDGMVEKVNACCRATAGFKSEIIQDEVKPQAPSAPPEIKPIVKPAELMHHTIELYIKTVNDLVSQGYPRNVAEAVAKKHATSVK